eukprot:snap_masked-scaffold_18-processed-gene-4.11-mRNA-1 protein AED:1.00 eAED:1.00 QI:0/0/0/0/1/1/2/0/640
MTSILGGITNMQKPRISPKSTRAETKSLHTFKNRTKSAENVQMGSCFSKSQKKVTYHKAVDQNGYPAHIYNQQHNPQRKINSNHENSQVPNSFASNMNNYNSGIAGGSLAVNPSYANSQGNHRNSAFDVGGMSIQSPVLHSKKVNNITNAFSVGKSARSYMSQQSGYSVAEGNTILTGAPLGSGYNSGLEKDKLMYPVPNNVVVVVELPQLIDELQGEAPGSAGIGGLGGIRCYRCDLPARSRKLNAKFNLLGSFGNFAAGSHKEPEVDNIVLCKSFHPIHAAGNSRSTPSVDYSMHVEKIFATELAILSGLSHPNIVSLHGYQEIPLDSFDNEYDLVERRIFTDFSVDNLRTYITHRTGHNPQKLSLPVYEAHILLHQISDGLSYLHENNIAHGNLCAKNIQMKIGLLSEPYRNVIKAEYRKYYRRMMGANPEDMKGRGNPLPNNKIDTTGNWYKFLATQPTIAKISNFGHSVDLTQVNQDDPEVKIDFTRGDPRYMAPELFHYNNMVLGVNMGNGTNSFSNTLKSYKSVKNFYQNNQQQMDPASLQLDVSLDMWSFGCIIYEVLTTRPPFYRKGKEMKDYQYVEARVRQGRFPKKEKIASSKYAELDEVMRGCLKMEPALRSTAREVFENLERTSMLR